MRLTSLANSYDSHDVAEISLDYNGKQTSYRVFRHLLLIYAGGLGKIFYYKGITSIKLENISPLSFEAFLAWLQHK
jgi:hypothetical protein